jgi:hypothetical protein
MSLHRARRNASWLVLPRAPLLAAALPGRALGATSEGALTARQRSVLQGIAADTCKFYAADVDPTTHLPLDNLGPGAVRCTYTSAANIGVYLWAVVAAHDLRLISRQQARSLITSTLDEVGTLKRYDGFLYQWYDTTNGKVLLNPGQGDCTETSRARTIAGSSPRSTTAGTRRAWSRSGRPSRSSGAWSTGC